MLNAYSDQDKLYVHYGARFFRKERMPEVKNGVSFMRSKPSGGLCASPVNAEYGWIDFCKNEEFRDYEEGNRFFFRIDDNARIFHIFCMEDMFQLPEQIDYVRDEDHSYRIDFEKALKDGIDAIELHLSEEKPCEFDKQLRISMPYWDCDCIFIMNPEIIDTRLGFLKDFLKG